MRALNLCRFGKQIAATAFALAALSGCAQVVRSRVFRPAPLEQVVRWPGVAPEAVNVRTADGLGLKGLFWRPRTPDRQVLVFFHGRSGNHVDAAHYVWPLAMAGYGVVVASYRGYGGNPGSPDETGIGRDADAFVALAQRLAGSRPVYLVGHSLGAPVALSAASRSDGVAGVLGIGAIVGLKSAAPMAVRPFLRDRFSSTDAASRLTRPILLIHGHEDDIVPAAEAKRILATAPLNSTFVEIGGEGHRPDMVRVARLLPMVMLAYTGDLAPLTLEARLEGDVAIFRSEPSPSHTGATP